MIPINQNLLNGASKAMNVDGSSVPKSYLFTASQTTQILGLSCVLKDDGVTSFNKFGSITALTNGVLIRTTVNGVTTNICTIKDNVELCHRFPRNQFGNAAVLSILGIVTPEGFGDTNDGFIGYKKFDVDQRFILQANDTLEVVIQDNLTNIDLLEMSMEGCVENGS